ncbi:MAM domain-containing glycosylphosphatidylinositol anchor protein 1 [Liparis tanakae]|uniref:MAM domain-containing glycosylphosphatidylinositol anchor protein 1 n=1 Tax=Liparis tanakae TaxID=230148 RepID=A0A4Z2F8Y6_9TELE|nr:MAM domain-containing glycosylphosphatidylinositol anchor protein 1 [Liparis tanakae]
MISHQLLLKCPSARHFTPDCSSGSAPRSADEDSLYGAPANAQIVHSGAACNVKDDNISERIYTIKEGDTLVLQCIVKGHPRPQSSSLHLPLTTSLVPHSLHLVFTPFSPASDHLVSPSFPSPGLHALLTCL